MPSPASPRSAPAGNKVLVLRARLINAARDLADAIRPAWAGTAVVTVLLANGQAQAVVRFPSERP
jgi:hypothetical protein